MLLQIKRFFQQHLEPQMSPEQLGQQLRLAACALLMEVARMDNGIDADELKSIADSCQRLFDLDEAEIQSLLQMAQDEAQDATSLYQFTSLIHAHYDDERKFELLKLMWQVALADGQIQAIEEHLIRRVADLLYIPHARFTQARHLAQLEHNG